MRILLLPLATLVELVKRPIFWVIYPVAYLLREWVRTRRNPVTWILWCALDDTIVYDNINRGLPYGEYCQYGKRSPLVEKYLPYDFCRSFYWGAWRNNGINFMTLTEKWIGEKVSVTRKWESGKSFYEEKTFASGAVLPYLEYWIGGWRFQCGFISCGRAQLQLRKLL